MNQFRFVQAVDRFSQRVVMTAASTTDRWLNLGLGQLLAVANTKILRFPIGVMDQGPTVAGLPRVERPFRCVQDEIHGHR